MKWVLDPAAAKAETCHGIQGHFVALVPVSGMLVALAVEPVSPPAARALFVLGLVGWLLLSLWQGGRAFTRASVTGPVTHAHYIPWVAGCFSAALVGERLGWLGWDQMFFGAGVLGWLALESVLLQSLWATAPLSPVLRATFGIQLAPPAVGLVVYQAVTPVPQALVVHMLLGYALLQAFLLLRLLPWLVAQGWSASYWAASFGATGLAFGAQRAVAENVSLPTSALAGPLFFFANGLVLVLVLGSAWGFFRYQRAGAKPPGLAS